MQESFYYIRQFRDKFVNTGLENGGMCCRYTCIDDDV